MPKIPHLIAAPAPAFASRRAFLRQTGSGFGLLALAGLFEQQGLRVQGAETDRALHPMAARPPHFPAKAKSVIWLFMNGGQSQVDTWDYKPELAQRDGQELPGFDKNTGFFIDQVGPLMKSPFAFAQHGETGTWVSEIFPHLAKHVDDLAFLHGCYTETNNHSPALFQINTGMSRMGFPCVGAWVTYGLGSENQNLPGFVVMYDTLGRGLPKGHAQNWGSGFLPGVYQGTALNGQGPPIDNLQRPAPLSDSQQRQQLDLLSRLNIRHREEHPAEAALAARIESFELAYRMQMAAPEALDVDQRIPRHEVPLRPGRPQVRPLRPPVPHGPSAGRARRAVRADLLRRHGERAELGRPSGHRQEPRRLRPRNRPADRRLADRPEAARTARRDAGRLLRRVRPPADRAERRAPVATTTHTPSPPGWPAAA